LSGPTAAEAGNGAAEGDALAAPSTAASAGTGAEDGGPAGASPDTDTDTDTESETGDEAPVTPRSIPGQRERVLLSAVPDPPELAPRKAQPRRAQPHQLSTYTYRNELPHLDLETRLGDETVCQAALDLAGAPEDESARQALLTALTSDGSGLTESRTLLQVTVLRGSGGAVAEFLDELVLMRDLNVRAFAQPPAPGGSSSPAPSARVLHADSVYAVAPNRAARDLLSGVPGFTRALVNWAMISDDADRPDHEAAFQRAVENMPMELLDAITHAIRRAPPLPGVPLRVDRLSGIVTTLPEEQATEVPGESFPTAWRSERRFHN
jgi:hypothetical protein